MTSPLTHAAGCPQDPARLDVTDHPAAGITTTHCLDCGAHHPPAGTARPTTGALAPTGRTWHDGIGLLRPTEGRIDPKRHNHPSNTYEGTNS
ncbi:hypothetical protein EUA06_11200 [Nocardioides glacieisoli]|uniref:Uncharacterized protein n=1 Tax=Nocardioides glacieisoli TaxID=1168730 RepID=A0A4Q2RSP7_9ACTN|nr:hypothetical protein [Nocardioides glacieisoli]RYB90835.1 hypothetical protein EUA06_11200 [Nocardioides glacieisoli]